MPRSMWNGSISFGLVNIPVKLYTATKSREISLRTLCGNNHPLEYKRWCPVEKREIPWQEVKKGYELTEERIIPIDREDLERIKIRSAKTIAIQKFVDVADIDPILVEKSYYIAPQENISEKSYALLVESLRLSGKAAIGKVTLRDKEYVVAMRPYKNALLLHILHFSNEIRPVEDLPELKRLKDVSKNELELAQVLIDKMTEDDIDIEKFEDEYTAELKRLIEAKMEGREFSVKEETPETEAKSLMEALKASVERTKKRKKG